MTLSNSDNVSTGLAILLGSGLGSVCEGLDISDEVPFSEIPGVGGSGVEGHDGTVRVCEVTGKTVIFVLGRKHYYEGSEEPIFALMNFLHQRGVTRMISTSATGSLKAALTPGDIVSIEGIIDLQFRRPAALQHQKEVLGQPEMTSHINLLERGLDKFRSVLDRELRLSLERAAERGGVSLKRGTLAAMPGPCYETRAEVSALQKAGADLATMSAAAEIAFAARLGIRIAALGVVTNYVTGFSKDPLSHDDVVGFGRRVGKPLQTLLTHFFEKA